MLAFRTSRAFQKCCPWVDTPDQFLFTLGTIPAFLSSKSFFDLRLHEERHACRACDVVEHKTTAICVCLQSKIHVSLDVLVVLHCRLCARATSTRDERQRDQREQRSPGPLRLHSDVSNVGLQRFASLSGLTSTQACGETTATTTTVTPARTTTTSSMHTYTCYRVKPDVTIDERIERAALAHTTLCALALMLTIVDRLALQTGCFDAVPHRNKPVRDVVPNASLSCAHYRAPPSASFPRSASERKGRRGAQTTKVCAYVSERASEELLSARRAR